MNPTIEVIKLQAMNQMLAGSPADFFDEEGSGDQLLREFGDFNFEEDSFDFGPDDDLSTFED